MTDSFDRLPPHSLDAEIALIGSMAIDRSVIPESRTVGRDAFYSADNQIIFGVLLDLYDRGGGIDPLVIREELIRRGLHDEIGGSKYLAQILNAVPSSAHFAQYAAIVLDRHHRRCLIAMGNQILRDAYEPSGANDAHELIGECASKLAEMAAGTATKNDVESIGDILGRVRAELENGGTPLVPTCFDAIDNEAGGIGMGELWLLGARPSMGKSTLAKQIALRCAMAGVGAFVVSLEEGKEKIGRNLIASEARVENKRMRLGRLGPSDWESIDPAIQRMASLPLYATDRARTAEQIRSMVTWAVTTKDVKLVIIDYLQLINAGGRTIYEQTGAASRFVAELAKSLKVAVLCPVQLNRAVEHRDDKRPGMADLRDSGQIEQDADGILFLHREDYYHLDDATYSPTHEAEVICAKFRDGARGGIVKLRSQLKYQTFTDLASTPPRPVHVPTFVPEEH